MLLARNVSLTVIKYAQEAAQSGKSSPQVRGWVCRWRLRNNNNCSSCELPGRLTGMPLGLRGYCHTGVELRTQLVGALGFTHLKMCNLIFGLPTLEPVVLGGTSNTTVSFMVSLCRQTDAAAH